ncbi:MAG: hypothetical protein ACHQ5A_08070, partial [Opitutales bacterium]
ELGAGSWELGAGSWELGAGSWELGAGSWELGAGSLPFTLMFVDSLQLIYSVRRMDRGGLTG